MYVFMSVHVCPKTIDLGSPQQALNEKSRGRQGEEMERVTDGNKRGRSCRQAEHFTFKCVECEQGRTF